MAAANIRAEALSGLTFAAKRIDPDGALGVHLLRSNPSAVG